MAWYRLNPFLLAIPCPWFVVERADRVSNTPVAHRAIRVEFDNFFEAACSLFLVETVAPDQTAVKPGLRHFYRSAYRPPVITEIEVLIHISLLENTGLIILIY